MKPIEIISILINGIGFVLSYIGFDTKYIPFILIGFGLIGVSLIIRRE